MRAKVKRSWQMGPVGVTSGPGPASHDNERIIFLPIKPNNMRKIIFLSLIIAVSALASCRFVNGKRVKGSGTEKTEDRSVGSFTSVSSFGEYDVYLAQDSGYSVQIEADDNLLPYIETKVNGGVLEIRTREGFWLTSHHDLKVHIKAPSFAKVKTFGSGNIISENKLNNPSAIELEVSGSGDVKVEVNAPEVRAQLSGSGNINLKGETKTFSGEIMGSGDIRASDLKAETVSVDIAGSGSADVYASVKLNVDVKGSGDVKYRGGAQVSSDIAGSGSVKKLD